MSAVMASEPERVFFAVRSRKTWTDRTHWIESRPNFAAFRAPDQGQSSVNAAAGKVSRKACKLFSCEKWRGFLLHRPFFLARKSCGHGSEPAVIAGNGNKSRSK